METSIKCPWVYRSDLVLMPPDSHLPRENNMTRQPVATCNISPAVLANGVLDSVSRYLVHARDIAIGIVEREKVFNCCKSFKFGLVRLVLLQPHDCRRQCGEEASDGRCRTLDWEASECRCYLVQDCDGVRVDVQSDGEDGVGERWVCGGDGGLDVLGGRLSVQ